MLQHGEQIIERDGPLEIRATIQHGQTSDPACIEFWRAGVYVMAVYRDSPGAKRWTWKLPSGERMRWLGLADRVAKRAHAIAEAARLADKPI